LFNFSAISYTHIHTETMAYLMRMQSITNQSRSFFTNKTFVSFLLTKKSRQIILEMLDICTMEVLNISKYYGGCILKWRWHFLAWCLMWLWKIMHCILLY